MKHFVLLLVLLCACSVQSPTGDVVLAEGLTIEASGVQAERGLFAKELRASGLNPAKRALYERYVGVIGANGLLDMIEQTYSECHTQAHDVGKVIFASTKDIGESLRVCAQRCYSGCMHGVLMEAFKDEGFEDDEGHIDVEKLKPKLQVLCFEEEGMAPYGPGECAHGMGHTVMFLGGYRVQRALDTCGGFSDDAMRYYCADGAFMEYLTSSPWDDSGKSVFYPCDSFKYSAACMRTKVGLAAKDWYDAGLDYRSVIAACEELNESARFGCFHGLGTSHSRFLVRDDVSIIDLCVREQDDESFACVEGALEFVGKYWPKKHHRICAPLAAEHSDLHAKCIAAGEGGLYRLDKDLTLYFNS